MQTFYSLTKPWIRIQLRRLGLAVATLSALRCGGSVANDASADQQLIDVRGTVTDLGTRDADLDGAMDVVVGSTMDSSLDAPTDASMGPNGDVATDGRIAPRPDVPDAPCSTRITYGSAWIHDAAHPAPYDDAAGRVSWDGVCHVDGANSYAQLSNGWRPYFVGTSSCIIALDVTGACRPAPAAACTTRLTYGPQWMHPAGHAADFDDVAGVVTWDGECGNPRVGESSAQLSNGWTPTFSGRGTCAVSIRHEQCDGLFENPVVAVDCPDPGVVRDGARYVMACTGGDYALRVSTDLINWRPAGSIFAPGRRPTWANTDFWAPEIHRVQGRWVAYFSARNTADRSLCIGAATGPTALGPFTDIGRPLVRDPNPGVIDAHHFEAPDGTQYLLYKVDGNDVGTATPIYAQRLGADGISLVGARTQLIREDQPWEGTLVEAPWMIFEGGWYYLFYSANGYASTRYAIGVARSRAPTGPFVKAPQPLLTSNNSFAGPGHGSVVVGPGGEWVHVYHAWVAGRVGAAPGRLVLADRLTWDAGWPHMFSAPSPRSQPTL